MTARELAGDGLLLLFLIYLLCVVMWSACQLVKAFIWFLGELQKRGG